MCYWKITPPTEAAIVAGVQFLAGFLTLLWLFLGSSEITYGGLFISIIITSIVNILISVVLVVAVIKNVKITRILHLRIWLSWEVVFLLYLLLSLVYISLFQFEYSELGSFQVFVLDGLLFFIHCLFLYTVFGFYEGTLLEKEEPPTRIVIHTEI